MPFSDPDEKRRYQREWIARRRAAWFEGKRCVDCGATEDLELDHRDPAEKENHRIWSWSLPRLEAELAKCDVRCGTCHDERHASERRAPCGTNSAYTRGCHCEACRAAHALAARESRGLARAA